MDYLPDDLFLDPVRSSLQTLHRRFAVVAGEACRYRAEVAPFASLSGTSDNSMHDLGSLLQLDEFVWIPGESFPDNSELMVETSLPCIQMALPPDVEVPAPAPGIVALSDQNAAEMVALTDVAFPGFFRPRTCEMGTYYGMRSPSGELIAMAGERMQIEGYPEVSGVCTHPAHRSKGLAGALMWRVISDHRRDGVQSWLHVAASNSRAIALYQRMGFVIAREIMYHRIRRV